MSAIRSYHIYLADISNCWCRKLYDMQRRHSDSQNQPSMRQIMLKPLKVLAIFGATISYSIRDWWTKLVHHLLLLANNSWLQVQEDSALYIDWSGWWPLRVYFNRNTCKIAVTREARKIASKAKCTSKARHGTTRTRPSSSMNVQPLKQRYDVDFAELPF